MQENDSELRVIGRNKGGRCRYDKASKRALVEACLRPGVSIAGMALKAGVNANLLRKWIGQYLLEREGSASAMVALDSVHEQGMCEPAIAQAIPVVQTSGPSEVASSAFVPVVHVPQTTIPAASDAPSQSGVPMMLALHVRLPNGVEFDLGEARIDELTTLVQILGRMPCSGSTTI